MLKLTRVVGCIDATTKTLSANTTEKRLCVLHFTDCTDSILAGTFAASDYAITAHLDAYKDAVSEPKDANGVTNFNQWITDIEKHLKTINNGVVDSAYGFEVPVCDIVPDAKMLIMGGVEIGTRRIMGIGSSKETARIDAINREVGRVNFAIAKGRCEVKYGEQGGEAK